jgi:hypothetical protein
MTLQALEGHDERVLQQIGVDRGVQHVERCVVRARRPQRIPKMRARERTSGHVRTPSPVPESSRTHSHRQLQVDQRTYLGWKTMRRTAPL